MRHRLKSTFEQMNNPHRYIGIRKMMYINQIQEKKIDSKLQNLYIPFV